MKRLLILTAVAFGFLLVLAPAALAKGGGAVVIVGPGLSKPIEFKGVPNHHGEGPFWGFVSQTGVFEAYAKAPTPPDGFLGPRYAMTIYISAQESGRLNLSKADRFEAVLYPYAEAGPVVFVPERARTRDFGTILTGWEVGTSSALAQLVQNGLPPTSPVPILSGPPVQASPAPPAAAVNAAGPGPRATSATRATLADPSLWIGLAALALTALIVGVALRDQFHQGREKGS